MSLSADSCLSSVFIKIKLGLLGLLLYSVGFSQADKEIEVYWKKGFRIETPNNNFKFKFGGRIMYDLSFFSTNRLLTKSLGKMNYGGEFRRIRFYNKGDIYKNLDYKFQVEVAGGFADFKDVYIQLSKIPLIGKLRIGHFKDPLRLETLTSCKYLTFMERSPGKAFSPERSLGIMISNETPNERISWQIAYFRGPKSLDLENRYNRGYNLTYRITGLVWRSENKEDLLLVGMSFNHSKPTDFNFNMGVRPESHLAPKYIYVDLEYVKQINLLNWSLALVKGPFSFQGEMLTSRINSMPRAIYTFNSFYGQISYFITGEQRNYKGSYSGFGEIQPHKNFGANGMGAWEVGIRFSTIESNDKEFQAGKMNSITSAVNWYINEISRISVNYIFVNPGNVDNTNILQMRFQVAF